MTSRTYRVRGWALDDPDGKDPEAVCEIRDGVEGPVVALYDEREQA